MRPHRARFTIRSLMITVGVVASFLALSRWPAWPLLPFCGLDLIPAAMLWRKFRGFRRLAALGFGVVGTSTNLACAVLGIYCPDWGGLVVEFMGWFLTFPLVLGLGAAWASAATHPEAVHRRSARVAWPLVFVLAILPLTMVFAQWPFRLAFLASKSALDRLADRVAVGQVPRRPLRAGPFLVVGSVFDPSTGNVGLVTDPNPGGRSGFIRYRLDPSIPGGRRNGPFINLFFDLQLCNRWWYECED
jgi:hypothetical protein